MYCVVEFATTNWDEITHVIYGFKSVEEAKEWAENNVKGDENNCGAYMIRPCFQVHK